MGDDPFTLAARALRQRERSRRELAEWLAKRGVEDAEAEGAIARLEAIGELDDARFARRYAEDKRELAGWGSERIRDALHARGIDEEDIDDALGDAAEDDLSRAKSLLVQRGEALDSESARGRALAFLARRGYPYELAYDAVRACERGAA